MHELDLFVQEEEQLNRENSEDKNLLEAHDCFWTMNIATNAQL